MIFGYIRVSTQDQNLESQKNLISRYGMDHKLMVGELERDYISERTIEGLKARVAKGIKLGKPKGTIQKSIYDKDKDKIFHLYQLGVPINKMIETHLGYGKYLSLREYIEKRKSSPLS